MELIEFFEKFLFSKIIDFEISRLEDMAVL